MQCDTSSCGFDIGLTVGHEEFADVDAVKARRYRNTTDMLPVADRFAAWRGLVDGVSIGAEMT